MVFPRIRSPSSRASLMHRCCPALVRSCRVQPLRLPRSAASPDADAGGSGLRLGRQLRRRPRPDELEGPATVAVVAPPAAMRADRFEGLLTAVRAEEGDGTLSRAFAHPRAPGSSG